MSLHCNLGKFVLKARTVFATKFVQDLNAKYQQWETAGEVTWGVALQRETGIRPLASNPRLSAENVAEAACLLGLSCSG